MIGVGAVIVAVAVLYRYCIIKRWRNRLVVDNQNMSAVFIFLAQIVDFYSDIVFAIQLNRYYNYSINSGNDLVDDRSLWFVIRCTLVFACFSLTFTL